MTEPFVVSAINDGNSDITLIEFRDTYPPTNHPTPHCKKHGAMVQVSKSGYWRCIRPISLVSGKVFDDCRAGCVWPAEGD